MAIAPVLKTGVRKDFWVRIPGPPSHFARTSYRALLVQPRLAVEFEFESLLNHLLHHASSHYGR